MKSGLMTFCGNTLEKICDTARVSYAEKTSTKKKRRIVKVGGGNNQGRKKYVICFHHEDPVDGDIWVMIVGNNQAGFSLAFANDKENSRGRGIHGVTAGQGRNTDSLRRRSSGRYTEFERCNRTETGRR